MKVIQLINGMTTGGAETLVKDYVTHSPEDLEQLVVLTNPFCEGPNEKAIRSAGVRLLSIPDRLGWTGKRRSLPVRAIRALLSKRMYIREFQRILREEKPDCVHAHLATLYLLAGAMKELEGIRVVYTCHTEVTAQFPEKDKRELERVRELVRCRGLRLIGLHERMVRELDALFGQGTSLMVNNCVDLGRFRERKEVRESYRKELGIPGDAFVIGHVGRFVPSKNQSFLVDLLGELRGRGVNAFALMVGSGETQQEVREKLVWYGLDPYARILQNRGDIPQLMQVMDTFVFPSQYEGFAVVMLEAQAAGLKCVISDSVPLSVKLTELVVPVSLRRGRETWCDAILSPENREPGSLETLEQFDVSNVVKTLAGIYEGKNG